MSQTFVYDNWVLGEPNNYDTGMGSEDCAFLQHTKTHIVLEIVFLEKIPKKDNFQMKYVSKSVHFWQFFDIFKQG